MLSGRYRVDELIGRGGMASVYRGRDLTLGREVAIKILKRELADDSAFRMRFRLEAQAASRMSHPTIVRVFDAGEEVTTEADGTETIVPYIVMEHIEGRLLKDMIADAMGDRESLRHFLLFGETLLDKMLAIGGRYPRDRVVFSGHQAMMASSQAGQGGVIITAHMGCLELMQMAASWREGLRVTILVHTAHAPRFNRILERINPRASVRLMQVTDFSPTTAMLLADRVAAGEFIAIAGDRVPVRGDRVAHARFLGHPAQLPAGPYLIASVLRCPVWLLSCLHDGAGYRADILPFSERITLSRSDRQAGLDEHAARFAAWMTGCLRQSPYDWFNFFPFWDAPR